MVSPPARKAAVRHLVDQGTCSERRACRLVGITRSVVRAVPQQDADEMTLIARLRTLAGQHGRYGYRRISVLLRREGFPVNHKRLFRLWQQEGLALPARRPRRRQYGPRGHVRQRPTAPNQVWSYDFVEDRTTRGRRVRLLNILDEYTRECLASRIEPSMAGAVVIDTLQQLFRQRGRPSYLRSDNGPEFVARTVQDWLKATGCQTLYITPGSPWENAYIESFNGKLRDECLNRELFHSGQEARRIVESWRHEYNRYRPHSALGNLTPCEFAAQAKQQQPSRILSA